MSKAIIYLRSATGNPEQIRQQEAYCRSYLRERDLAHAGTIIEAGHSQEGLTDVIDTASKNGATEIVVTDLSRLGRQPQVSMRNLDAFEAAGLTIHTASGTLDGPALYESIEAMMYQFAFDGDRHSHGDTKPGD